MSENRTYLEKKALYAIDVFHTHVRQIKFSSPRKEVGDSKRNMKCTFQELFFRRELLSIKTLIFNVFARALLIVT